MHMNEQAHEVDILPDATTDYATAVCAGWIVAGPLVRLACKRHLDDLRDGHQRGLAWDPGFALLAFEFFERLQLAEGEHAGQPFTLQPWQKFVIGSLFGWIGEDGYRRFRTAYIEVGKGNGKTPMAAAIGLKGLVADNEPSAEVYSAAVSQDQAGICFRDAKRYVEASPALMRRITITENNLAYVTGGSFFRPVSSERRTLDGKRVHIGLADELHEHASANVVDKLRLGMKGRRQPLIVEITNSGYDRNSVCWLHHEQSRKILEGVLHNDSWFAFVCDLDADDDWQKDEACWPKANPNLDISITRKYLRELVDEAREMPSKQNIVARLNFCVWTQQSTRWIELAAWDECGDPVDPATLKGRACYGGLDLSVLIDITALCWVFPPAAEGEKWKFIWRFWVPKDRVEKRVQRDHIEYDVWVRDGVLTVTPGNVVDYAWIRKAIQEDGALFDVKEIAFDRFNSSQIVTCLQDDGFTMVPFGQGFVSMSGPSKEFEKIIVGRQAAHGGNPVARWMASNVSVRQDPAGNIKPDRVSSTERIDGIVAAVMGLGRATLERDDGIPGYKV